MYSNRHFDISNPSQPSKAIVLRSRFTAPKTDHTNTTLPAWVLTRSLRNTILIATTIWLFSGSVLAIGSTDVSSEQANILEQPLAPAGVQLSKKEIRRLKRERRQAAKAAQKELKKLSQLDLEKEAEQGDRIAQIVLATEFAEEAMSWSAIPAVANAALSDAAYWYSLAAKRGYPGSPAIDGVLPSMPLRVVRKR